MNRKDKMEELWKYIRNNNDYMVSNIGNVRSLDRDIKRSDGVTQHRKGRILSQQMDKDGYMTVKISHNGKSFRVFVHKLVAEAFVCGWFDGSEVNHKDFDRTNNTFTNLEWVSHSENVLYTIASGRHNCNKDLTAKNNPNFGNHVLSERYSKDKNYSIEKQSRPGSSNGMSKKVRMIYGNDCIIFGCLKECAEYMINAGIVSSRSVQVVSNNISKSARNGSEINNYSFILL